MRVVRRAVDLRIEERPRDAGAGSHLFDAGDGDSQVEVVARSPPRMSACSVGSSNTWNQGASAIDSAWLRPRRSGTAAGSASADARSWDRPRHPATAARATGDQRPATTSARQVAPSQWLPVSVLRRQRPGRRGGGRRRVLLRAAGHFLDNHEQHRNQAARPGSSRRACPRRRSSPSPCAPRRRRRTRSAAERHRG